MTLEKGHKIRNTGRTRFKKGQTPWNKGKSPSDATRKKIGDSQLGKKRARSINGIKSFKEKMSGKNNPRWVSDRSKVDMNKRSNWSPECIKWRESIFKRDGYKCKINNSDCCVTVQAHHILNWKDYPGLRFNINNGITLCLVHHPRKRTEVTRLISYFLNLIGIQS